MFARSQDLVDECDLTFLHVFPYSPRPGTPAARMPQVDPGLIKLRAARLRSACAERRAEWLASLVGSDQHVLVETSGLAGHAENFAPVRFTIPRNVGSIASVTIAGLEDGVLIAQERDLHV
jgi:threonylcarbamoyladenosine tRNA methylthiotransferase MtaB